MRAGRLRHYVTIEKTVETRSATGGFKTDWAPFIDDDVPAEIMSVTGREFFTSSQEQHDVDTKITMRRMPGLTTKMRIVYEGEIYNIRAILPDPKMREYFLVMCTTGADQG